MTYIPGETTYVRENCEYPAYLRCSSISIFSGSLKRQSFGELLDDPEFVGHSNFTVVKSELFARKSSRSRFTLPQPRHATRRTSNSRNIRV